MELAWKAGLMDFAMPYMIQITRDMFTRLDTVQKKNEDREKKEEQAAKQQMTQPIDIYPPGMMGDTPMLMNAPESGQFAGFGGMGSSGMGSSGMGTPGMGTPGIGMGLGMGSGGNTSTGGSGGFGQFTSWR